MGYINASLCFSFLSVPEKALTTRVVGQVLQHSDCGGITGVESVHFIYTSPAGQAKHELSVPQY